MIAFLLALLAEQYTESITVARYILMARVIDSRGAAVRDLGPSHFSVTIGGKPAEVEAVEWQAPAASAEQEGRLIVFFIASDFAKNAPRIAGQLRFNAIADDILKFLGPRDQAAVFSYDSHLKLRADFTRDHAFIHKAIRDSIGSDLVPLPPGRESGPSLARHLDAGAMRNAFSMEAAMLQVAEVLNLIEGERILIMAGYGLGEKRGTRVFLQPEWHTAMALLQRMRAPVITLNTGVGGELSLGLIATAKTTSGVYAFTQDYPRQSVDRVAGMLAGRYELVVKTAQPLEPGRHAVDIRVARLKVLSSPIVVVEPAEELKLERVEETKDRTGFDLFLNALRRLQSGEIEGVEEMLTRVIELEPDRAEAFFERGMLLAARGENDAAAADLRRYLDLEPDGRRAREAREMLRALGVV